MWFWTFSKKDLKIEHRGKVITSQEFEELVKNGEKLVILDDHVLDVS